MTRYLHVRVGPRKRAYIHLLWSSFLLASFLTSACRPPCCRNGSPRAAFSNHSGGFVASSGSRWFLPVRHLQAVMRARRECRVGDGLDRP
ncbi:hypothetical protein MKEN_00930900 [Mycena kentingensis (nom. inval.)]|nr:hypothetical protein MKEN_00930900 [Mycena kentingensis (nom. inval.)]